MEYLSLSEVAYRRIKEAILRHEIVPGQKLYHEDLVQKLSISQTPIREALSRLAQEGYLTRLTNRGYYVSEMTAEEAADLFGLREALENFCLAKVPEAITPGMLKELESNLVQLRRALATNAPLIERFIINRDFHMKLAKIAGNDVVYRVLDDACEKLLLKRKIEGFPENPRVAAQRHADIMAALKRKNIGRAQEIMSLHLNEVKNTLIEEIKKGKKASATG